MDSVKGDISQPFIDEVFIASSSKKMSDDGLCQAKNLSPK